MNNCSFLFSCVSLMRTSRYLLKLRSLLAVLLFTTLLSGCDGGLFGTGDGDIDVIAVDATAPTTGMSPGNSASDSDIPMGSPQESNGESQGMIDEAASITPTTLAFSNTLPSGLSDSDPILPAAKVINVSPTAVTASTNVQGVSFSQDIAAQQSGALFSINTGESSVTLGITSTPMIIASVNPLNAVSDSITSIIFSASSTATAPDTNEGAADNTLDLVSITALDTRAQATSRDMVDVRVVSLSTTSVDSRLYTLTPVSDNGAGVQVGLTLTQARSNLTTLVSPYALANPGNYVLSSPDTSTPSQTVLLEAGQVYTLIVTNLDPTPLIVEVDSISP